MKKGKEENVPNRKSKSDPKTLFQFKITLVGSNPPIWRRIQVENCTLDELHEHIQTAMGWSNSHLHNFEIRGKEYGDPELLDDGFEAVACIDSTKTMVSKIMPRSRKPFSFIYVYDFGDHWGHEIRFEGCPQPEAGTKYPVCLEGARARPPEDIGGVWGYENFLTALADLNHEDHEQAVEYHGSFDPDQFDAGMATRRMQEGVPDWSV